jgi:GTP-binding protein YchF
MSFSIGIVGLPNVGKSTLFNALTGTKQANVQNYPFCTIDPNVGVVEVPDERLQKLADVSKSKKIIPTTIEFVDIAGLVKGASEGEGLGNKFLAHIKEVDAIAHVVRNFEDSNITHVHNRVNALEDAGIINTELVLADLQVVGKRLEATKKSAKGTAIKELQPEIDVLEKIYNQLEQNLPARLLEYNEDELIFLKTLQLITMKPMMYVVNVDEQGTVAPQVEEKTPQIEICARMEAELADLSPEEGKEYLKSLGIEKNGLDKLISAGYGLLQLITYFTSGEQETRAWTITTGTKAPAAAGVIHTDFIKGFIKADVVGWEDFVQLGGWGKLRESGKMRLEGKEYLVKDGDVCYFHVNT